MLRTRRLFFSATAKLTVSYLAVLVIISLFFSTLVFGIAGRELRRTLTRPGGIISQLPHQPGFGKAGLEQILAQREQESRRILLSNLAYLNGAILVIGGLVSYGLARATLRPIERSHAAQSQFASDASHELRTPLTAIKTEIEVALQDPGLDLIKARLLLKSNLEEVGKLSRLSEGLLSLAQADSKDTVLKSVSLGTLLKRAVVRVQSKADRKHITITQPTNAPDIFVRADAPSLEELFVILLDNAINYSPSGSKVSVSTTSNSRSVTCSVSDSGRGVTQHDRQRIFERFYRATPIGHSRLDKNTAGYGLGLAIAQSIAHAHKTKISLKSAPGAGSTFYIALQRD